MKLHVVAHYLPQFSPCNENDSFWGPGFTEWHNVANARSLFPGHIQPNLPGELGFYDLRVPQTREAQWDLASTHGVDAFCYWYYWFGNGRRVLSERVDELLEGRYSNQTYCLGWANESWTGVWHGAPGRVLIEQTYTQQNDHLDYLIRHFKQPNYLRVDDRPLLYIYRPMDLPHKEHWVRSLRDLCRSHGVSAPYLVGEAAGSWIYDPVVPFDAYCWNPPPPVEGDDHYHEFAAEAIRTDPRVYEFSERYFQWITDARPLSAMRSHQAVVCGFDNTPRSGRAGVALVDISPARLEAFVRKAASVERSKDRGPHILFVKSWNEWAEGSVLEPSWLGGRGLIEGFRRGLEDC